ncbi:MAG: sensor histidine kinase [Myxococcales bacterium]
MSDRDLVEPTGEYRAHSTDQIDTSQLLRRVSHELLTPLTTVRLALQLGLGRIQRGDRLEPASLQRALSQVDEIVRLISQLREAAHLMSDEPAPTGQVIELGEMLRRQVDQFVASRPKHSWQLLRSDKPVQVRADRGSLEQVLVQLLDNACKFSSAGSEVLVTLSSSDGQASISIADQGIGIPANIQRRVFELFFRAPNAVESSARGLGIGLFIARELLSKCAGRLWVESKVGGGSTFHVVLPVYSPPDEGS